MKSYFKVFILFLVLFFSYSIYSQDNNQKNNYTSKVTKQDGKGNTLERVFYDGNNKEIAHLYWDEKRNQIKSEGKIPEGIIIKSFYDDGNLQREAIYKNNKLDEICKDFYEDGNIKTESIFKNGKQNGICKNFYGNGNVKSEANWIDDIKEGVEKGYFESGNLQYEANYKYGLQEGVYKEYYDNGKIKIEANFKNNLQEGLEKEYYESGNLQNAVNLKNGLQEGVKKEYYEDGKIKGEVNFKNNKKEGVEKGYFENGKLKIEANFKYGLREGVEKGYFESGNLQYEANYKNDLQEGLEKEYDENGNLKGVSNFKEGELDKQDNKNELDIKSSGQDFDELTSSEGFKIDIPYNAKVNLPENNETEKLFKLMVSQFKHRPITVFFKTGEMQTCLNLVAWMIKHYKYVGSQGFGGSENVFIYSTEDQDFSITISPLDYSTRSYGVYIVVNAIN